MPTRSMARGQISSGSTRSSTGASGRTTATSTWWTPGPRATAGGTSKFRLEAIEADEGDLPSEDVTITHEVPRNRVIPSHIKQEVWKRDNGRCVLCGSADELHFDHVLPFSRGGTSLTASNVQLLCVRHNLQKSAKIE